MPEESRELRKSRRIRWLRHLLLVATLLAVAAVVAVYLIGRRERDVPKDEGLGPASVEPTGDMVTVGKGFERTFTEGNRPVFTIRGESFAVDREGVVYLTGVGLTVYQEDGTQYQVAGKKARVDVKKKEARLTGAVKLSGPEGMVLTTKELLLTHRGHRVRSPGEVHLALGAAYRGRADHLAGWLKSRRFVLSGLVDVRSVSGAETPFRLQTRELTVDRTRKLLHTDGWAVLRHGPDLVSAREMVLFFADDERTMRFLRAHRRVRGTLRQESGEDEGGTAGAPGFVAFRTENLGLLFAEDGRKPKQVDLDKGPGGRALLRSVEGPENPRYRLTAPAITGYFQAGRPVRAEAGKGVVFAVEPPRVNARQEEEAAVEETPPEAPAEAAGEAAQGGAVAPEVPSGAPEDETQAEPAPAGEAGEEEAEGGKAPAEAPAAKPEPAQERRATGQEATASFGAGGGLSKVELTGNVVLTDADVTGHGARAVFAADSDKGELFGRPATLDSDRGRMEAPHILYTRNDGLLHGTGGVRARLEEADDTALGGTPLTRGDGPVWVEAEEGYLRDQPRSFLFHGRVRAWRGENLLVADDLRGDDAEHRLVASGSVRTLWTPENGGSGAAGAAKAAAPGEPAKGGQPVQTAARAAGEPPVEPLVGPPAAAMPAAGSAAGAGGAKANAAGGEGPLEATSDELTYRRDQRLLVYTGDVTAKQEGRTLTCHEMEIHLAEQGGMEKMVCTGDVHVDDPGQGRSLTGERAVYDPRARTVEVEAAEGGKVTMHDKDGNVIEGPRMIYEIDQNRVHVLGPPSAAPKPAPEPARPPATPSAPPPEPPPR